jgi:chromosome segregation ATPase
MAPKIVGHPASLIGASVALLIAISGWAYGISARISTAEAKQAALEERVTRAEQDAEQYRKDISDLQRDISWIRGQMEANLRKRDK